MGLLNKLFKDKKTGDLYDYIDFLILAKKNQLAIKQHAIQHAVDLIAKTISKSEIKIYRKDPSDKKIKAIKNGEYYRLNVKPNDNEEATSFFYGVLTKYLLEEDALIVNFNDQLYLADSYNVSSSLLSPKVYKNVQISDNDGNILTFNHTFSSDEIIRLNLKSSQIKESLDDYYTELGKLLGIASSRYKLTNHLKFRLKLPGSQPRIKDPVTNKEMDYSEYKAKITKGLFDEEDAVILLSETFGLEKIDFGEISNSDEWSSLEKKWSDKVAMSFNIPLDIFYGNKTDKSTSTTDFITFGVLPHLQIFEDGLNAKIISKDDYLNGECIKVNRLNMIHKDILDSATNIDKLFADGYSHNEINEFVGLQKLDEKWADEHYITKNYENVNITLKGGEDK